MAQRGSVGLFTSGMWALRAEVAAMTGLVPVRRLWGARGLQAVAGWGHKPTAARARAAAARAATPYLAVEDGFFRSVRPGGAERSASYVLDAEGIFYDARGPSALERLVRARAADPARAEADAAPALAAIREAGLSKYNLFDGDPAALETFGPDPAVAALVVDQTLGDAAIEGAGADAATFRAMLAAAAAETPAGPIVIKSHPESLTGRRPGCLDDAQLARAAADSPALRAAIAEGRLRRLTAALAPRDVLARAGRVYAVSSLLGFEALILGARVVCFGQAFYAGWGLTEDRAPPTGRRRPVPLPCLAAAAFADYARYFGPDRKPCAMEAALADLAVRRVSRRA